MVKKSMVLLIVLFIGGLAFIFRNQLINSIQQRLLRSLDGKAIVDNRQLLQDPCFTHHLLYSLKGADRLWPHRVNSLQRLRYLYGEFPGFECDIQFLADSGILRIGHDAPAPPGPEGSGHDVPDGRDPGPAPDTFVDYLKLDSPRRKLFWLDIKNVNAGNIHSFCDRLHVLDSLYSIRQRVIIELYDTLTALTVREQGFLTALNAGWIDSSRIPVMRTLYPQRINLLSSDAGRLPMLRRDLPGSKQIAWDIAFRNGISRDNLLKMANDTDLLVCLINVKSPGYR